MSTYLKKFCLFALFISILVSSQIIALPLEVLNDPNFILPIDREPIVIDDIQLSTAQANNETENMYTTGDSLSFLCSDNIFMSGVGAGSDCWGWVDSEGTEYAIYATWNSIEFYNLETATFVGSIPAPTSTWHDIKSYQNYCYAVSEGYQNNAGLLIIDMQYLPDSVHFVDTVLINNQNNGYEELASHNLSIDTATGYAYIEGTNDTDFSIHILSLADPENPTYINSFGPGGGLHDVFCHNDTLYLAEGTNKSISIWNMANKNVPELLTRWVIPNAGYVHNVWPSGDKRHVLTTEETPGKTIKLWNIEDLQNVQLIDEYLAPSGLAHNAHMVGDTAYVSHYESGVVVLDISSGTSIEELYLYDTYPDTDDPDFNGCWGVYPHTPSGRFYASNMAGQLFVIKDYNVVLADTLIALDAQALPGSSVRVDIWAKFILPMHEFEFPFNWAGPLNLKYDSISTVGLMTEYFEVQQLTAYDGWFSRAAALLRASPSSTSPDLPPGEGIIMSIFFTIPVGATGVDNPITFTPFNGKEPSFRNACVNYAPDTLSGAVVLGDPACCFGIRGNYDQSFEDPPNEHGIDISDLILLVAHMFQGGAASGCPEEADINGSGGNNPIDISDLISLVAFMFQEGNPPADCP